MDPIVARKNPSSSSTRRRRAMSRRGLTLLEIVLAMAMIGLATAASMSSGGVAMKQAQREQLRMDCAELANRMMMTYLDMVVQVEDDDKYNMPSMQLELPQEYNGRRFRYSWSDEDYAVVTESETIIQARRDRAGGSQQRGISINRMKQVVVTVWLSESSGGARQPGPGVPSYTLVRLIDPLAGISRNADSMATLLNDVQNNENVDLIRVFGGLFEN